MLKKLFCNHDYNMVNQFDVKSEFQIITESGFTPKTWNSLRMKIVTDFKCSKCNRIKRRTVTTLSN